MSGIVVDHTTPSGNGLDAMARRHFRRNATLLVLENAGFLTALALVGSTTVLPAFVTRLGGSAFLVGLIGTFQIAGWLLPQLLAASLCAGQPRMLRYVLRPLYFGRPVFLIAGVATVLLGDKQPLLVLLLVYLAVLAFYATDALASVPWFELVGRVIPPRRRGRVLGFSLMLGGLGGIAAGSIVGTVLGMPQLPFPTSYGVLFALAGVVFLLALVPLTLIKEPDHEPNGFGTADVPSLRQFLGMLLPILRNDRNFVRLVVARLLFGVVFATLPFYVLYMERGFALGQERLGLFVSAQVCGSLAAGLGAGWIADRFGTKAVLRMSGLVAALTPALALAMSGLRVVSGDLLLPAGAVLFMLIGIAASVNLIGFMNYLLEVAPLQSRATYIGLFNTLAGVLLVIPPLAGWFVEVTSFSALFVASVVCALLCLLVATSLRQPRPFA